MPQKIPGASRRDFTRNRVKGPKFSGAMRRPEPYKSCTKAQNFPALRAGRPTTRFPHALCLYSPVIKPGGRASGGTKGPWLAV